MCLAFAKMWWTGLFDENNSIKYNCPFFLSSHPCPQFPLRTSSCGSFFSKPHITSAFSIGKFHLKMLQVLSGQLWAHKTDHKAFDSSLRIVRAYTDYSLTKSKHLEVILICSIIVLLFLDREVTGEWPEALVFEIKLITCLGMTYTCWLVAWFPGKNSAMAFPVTWVNY